MTDEKRMKVAVTGAGGFLGRSLMDRLLESEFEPVAIVKKETDAAFFRERNVECICRDLSEKDAFIDLFKGCYAVVHCAAARKPFGEWEDFRRINVEMTGLVMEYAAGADVKKIIHISNAAVYGNDRNHFGTDEEADYGERVVDYYTRSKIEAEKTVLAMIREKELPAVVLRPGYIWGPGDQGILPFIVGAIKSRRLYLADDGSNLLSLTYIDNVVEAIMLSLEKDESVGRVFNVTDGSKITSKQFIYDIIANLGIDYRPRELQYPVLYAAAYILEIYYRVVRRSSMPPLTRFAARFLNYNAVFDISRAIYDLGYKPRISYREGMTILTPYLRSLYYGAKRAQNSGG